MIRWILVPLTALYCMTACRMAASQPHPEIWFAPPRVADFQLLWDDNAPWQNGAKQVSVLTLVHTWVRSHTDAEILQVTDFAKRHGMKINLDTEAVAKFGNETCGGMEGYTYPGEIKQAIDILKRLNVRLDWVDVDEPLWFGHYATDPTACHVSVPELIDRVALVLTDVFSAYPWAALMEIEPVPVLMNAPTWRQDLSDFQLGLERKLGTKIVSLLVDVQWNNTAWKQAVIDMNNWLKPRGTDFSMIYNGSDQDQSNVDWIATAVRNINTVEGELGIIPRRVAFMAWNAYPDVNLPETSPGAETWLLNNYVKELSSLRVEFIGRGARGRLTTAGGKPIANATVQGYKPGVDYSKPMPTAVITGAVPQGAASAIIGIRVNAECDYCSGSNDLLIGTVQYQEVSGGTASAQYSAGTGPAVVNGVILGGETVGGVRVTRLIAAPGTSILLNSGMFPVTPGATFNFTVPAATVGGAGWFGNICVIWIGQNQEVGRLVFTPQPGKALMSTAVTDAAGLFTLPVMPRAADGPAPVSVEYDGGGGQYRPTVWRPGTGQ